MKAKISKFNIVIVAITVLLIFVAAFNLFGQTNSWLVAEDTISISMAVSDIDIEVKQGDRSIDDEGFICLGTQFVGADKTYDFEDVNIHNNELAIGYYIRCQLFIKIGEDLYNINSCVENDLYKSSDGWMYYTNDSQSKDAKQMESKSDQDATRGVVPIIKSLTIPDLLKDNVGDTDDVYFSNYQGKLFTLHLFIEGSALKYNIV